jgi:phage N-6-adenine-methyltransferase
MKTFPLPGAELVLLPPADADARAIGELYHNARTSIVDSACYLAEAGRRLKAKKESLKHGEWYPWIEQNKDVLGFDTPQTAARLIKMAPKSNVNVRFDETEALEFSREVWGNKGPTRGTGGTGENEWYTPIAYLDRARRVLGGFDLDPASSERAQRTVQASRYFTKADDGLAREWHGRVWLNPPYAQPLIADFVGKMVAERLAGRVTSAVMLTHNYTDTSWFQGAAAVADAICFTRGRVRFVDSDGDLAAPTQGQAFFYFGDAVALFAVDFAEVGFVALPWRKSVNVV